MKLLIWIGLCLAYLSCSFPSPDKENATIDRSIALDTIIPEDTSSIVEQQLPDNALPIGIQRLLKAYPDFLSHATVDSIYWKDGTAMLYDDGIKDKDFEKLLNHTDLEDQMAQHYPTGTFALPEKGKDPGRFRYEPFFFKMYGASKDEVRQKLVEIVWLPKTFGVKLKVSPINGIAEKLTAISTELDSLPHLHKYLENPGGTFNWRNIAGTERISMHSFGITIDINVKYSNYWRWAIKGGDDNGTKTIVYKNRIPMEIVEIFEKHGFIWGGKWYHYDTMHFEYRPELLVDITE